MHAQEEKHPQEGKEVKRSLATIAGLLILCCGAAARAENMRFVLEPGAKITYLRQVERDCYTFGESEALSGSYVVSPSLTYPSGYGLCPSFREKRA